VQNQPPNPLDNSCFPNLGLTNWGLHRLAGR
jgi:hypothetical protein